MIDSPEITQTSAIASAIIHLTIPREKIRDEMGPAIGELMGTLAAQGVKPAGPVYSHHLRMDPATFDFEVGVPVSAPVAPTGRVRPGQLPAARVARTVYHGGYEGLGGAWGEFEAWLAANGHKSAANLWESYTVGPESGPDPAGWRTQLNRPLVGQ